MLKTLILAGLAAGLSFAADANPTYDYRVLATSKTSTMEKEMNDAAATGFVFTSVMGGETGGSGGKEVVVIMTKSSSPTAPRKRYRLLATSRTSTMQKELQQAGDDGYGYCGQTVFQSAFGGREVAVILERDADASSRRIEYKLLATNRTGTMQKELAEAGASGFQFLGLVVGKTALGGNELISILQKMRE